MSKLSRRQFVHTSAAAGAGLAVSGRLAHAVQSNEKIGVALIGAGGRGGSHLNAWLGDKRTDLLTIVDVDEKAAASRADAAEKAQGFRPKIVTDMREVFDDKSIDVISTATPNHWHALCGIWAMQAGKDAYIEKPVSHNIHEGTALIAAARKYDRICQVGTQCRSATAQQEMVDFIQAGGIGEVNFARGLCYKRRKSIGALGDYAVPDNVDFNLWSGPAAYTDPKVTRPRFHYDWHWQRLYGNGDSGNQGPHQTDVARWGLGIDTHPISVISYGGRLGYQAERKDDNYVDAGDTPNTQVSIYDYGDKCMVFETRGLGVDNSDDAELNKLFKSTKGNKIGVVFYGSNGYCVQVSYGHSIAYDADMNVIKEFKGAKDHFANFLDAVESRNYKDLTADVREGHLSASLSHLGNISLAIGEQKKMSVKEATEHLSKIKSLDDNDATLQRTIKHLEKNGVDLEKYPIAMGPLLKFDPEKEIFPENEVATAMCTREYRAPFVCPTADKV
ncbi:4-carboxy-2-hydroxymuconate-6-semialdehyde dehydrogenase [Rosistilla oblonga]|uniref:4-carboxy-2-hydroxymuconate-6-semialdehyde dehydrogenase n=1 Tax=Rosistilla oblonga TaxID=2527990 RepID=A0A518IXG6_9BACT|nr:Gfo/Idh/MocA family oxidoreductase [Rosistilla oblonga]QDV14026.1 4-carboxy-2-hydroxymuconate-6-semialdehyde dehydrogenase [Rosistilla oblonga]QDV57781.1 4-carboxy-2-hydroxymuconate-6-semialdehyde dehydrogenase [Rosistilla oblonga]